MVRRRTITRTALAAALVAAAAPGLAACSGSSGGSGDVSTISVLDYYGNSPDKEVYQKVIDACGKDAGVTIKRTTVPGGDLIAKVLQQSSSKTLPDVLMLDNPDLQQIAASGALAPLDQFGITADGYAQGVIDASTYKDKLYGLQPVTNTIALFYNKDVFAQAGLQPPTTWEELKQTATALTQEGRYGVAFSAVNTYEGTWQFLPFMWSNGGDEKDIATEQTAQALQLWVDMVKDGSASSSVVNWTQADVNDQFKAGNAAMMVNGPWQFPVLDADTSLKYGVVPLPAPKAGGTVVSPLGGETWTVPQTGDKAKQAKAADIVKCLNSDTNQLMLATVRDTVPTKTAIAEKLGQQDPAMEPFVTLVPDLRARTGELGADWPKAATNIYTAVQTAMTGGAEPLAALQQASDG